MAPKSDLLQGTLDLLILKTLEPGSDARLGHFAAHSGRFRRKCCRSTRDRSIPRCTGSNSRGSSMPNGANSENNRQAKFYQLTRTGRKQLTEETKNWERLSEAVARILAS